MNFTALVRVAWQALVRNAFRSLLTMLGIIIGVGAVITSMAIGNGASAAVAAQLARLGSNLIIVVPGSVITGGVNLGAGARTSLKPQDATAIAQIPGIAGVAPQSNDNGQVVAGGNNWATSILGTSPAWLQVQNWTVAQGQFFTNDDMKSAAKSAVLGNTVALNLFPAGDAVGSMITIKGAPFTVIGVLAPKGQSGFGRDQDDQVVIPLTSMQLRINGNQYLSSITISASSPDAVASVVSSVDRVAAAQPSPHAEPARRLLSAQHRRRPGGGKRDCWYPIIAACRSRGRVARRRRHRHHEHHARLRH